MIIKLILTISLCIAAICGDTLVETLNDKHLLKAVVDNGTHAIIGGLSWCIVCIHRKSMLSVKEYLWQVALCTIISSMIDVDHFISARSLRLQDVHLLKSRPFLHNTALMVGIWIVIIDASFILKHQILNYIGWIFFVAFVSHHTRDATRRGYWCYPLGSSSPINYSLYIAITLLLPFVVTYLLNLFKPNVLQDRIINLGAEQTSLI